MIEEDKVEELHTLIALSAIFIEQSALDNGKLNVGWLMTGLQPPPFAMLSQTRHTEEPWASLADPSWVGAQLSYLKDLDYFENRQSNVTKGKG